MISYSDMGIYYSGAQQGAALRWSPPSRLQSLDPADCLAKELDG